MVIEKLEENTTRTNVNNHVYDCTSNARELNSFLGVSLNLNYKNVMHFFKYIEKEEYEKACFVIGITEQILIDKGVEYVEKLYKYLNSERFVSPDANKVYTQVEAMKRHGQIKTEEEEQEYIRDYLNEQRKQQAFCHFGDYDLVHSLFLEKYNIDLEKDDLSFFFYTFKLNAIMGEDSNALINRMRHRSFKPKSGKGVSEENKIGRKLKKKYSLV